jgi:hypothetical protein
VGDVVEDSKTGAKAINHMDEIFLLFKNVGVDGKGSDNLQLCCVVGVALIAQGSE